MTDLGAGDSPSQAVIQPVSARIWQHGTARPRFAVPTHLVAIVVWAGEVAAIVACGVLLNALGVRIELERLLPFVLVCFTAGARVTGAYDLPSLLYLKRCWPRIANIWLCTLLAIAALSAALDASEIAPLLGLAAWFLSGLIGIAVSRIVLVIMARQLKQAGAFDDSTAIVGTGPQAIDLAGHISRHQDLAVSLVGFFDDTDPATLDGVQLPLPYLGNIEALVRLIRAGNVVKVFVALPWSDEPRLRAVVEALSATPVEIRLGPDRAGFAYATRRVTSLAGLSIITLLERPLSGTQQALKGLEDRLLATIALVVLAPLMVTVAFAIKLTSPGPLLFRQQREGFNCKTFDILKFRTMYAGDGAPRVLVQAQRGDARVTPVGRFLRRSSIDELPQLWNVLAGHMSLVGPRPHSTLTRAGGRLFCEIAGTYAARHKVKPGLTGWAQVCGWRGETATEEALIRRLEHDIYYVEHWSIWFDLYILARTVATVLFQRNAF